MMSDRLRSTLCTQSATALYVAVALFSVFVESAVAAPPATKSATISATMSATMQTYERQGGETFFSLSLTPNVRSAAGSTSDSVSSEIVLLFDTSASQTGVYRETALAALQSCLNKLRPTDRVKIMAVDLDARSMTTGFVAPQSADATAAIEAIRQIAPLGSTDMQQALRQSVAQFESSTSVTNTSTNTSVINRSILYIGDGLSTANLLGTEAFRATIAQLTDAHVSVSGYAIGPKRDTQLLAALANQTGGNLYVDEVMVWADVEDGVTAERAEQENHRRGAIIGTMLADWTRATVLWPESVNWPVTLGEVYPTQLPPLRTDRDTIVVGSSQHAVQNLNELQVSVKLSGGQQLAWNIQSQPVKDDYAFLTQMVEMARKDGGITMTTLGTAGLNETGRMMTARLTSMTNLAQRAAAIGDVASANVLSQAVLKSDPNNFQAQTVQRVVQRSGGQSLAPRPMPAAQPMAANDSNDLNLVRVRVAQVEPLLAPPTQFIDAQFIDAPSAPFPAEGSLIDRFDGSGVFVDEVAQQKRVFAQMLRKEVLNTISDARDHMSHEPQIAAQQLKLALQNVDRAPELDADIRAQLVDRLQNALREVQHAAVAKDELDRAREESVAAARERRLLIERLARNREREKQLMNRFNSLMDEGHYIDAEEVAYIVEEIDPDGVMPRVAVISGQLHHNLHLAKVARAARWRGFFDTMYSIETSLIPFSGDPPIVYPDPAYWEELTHRRKKYSSVDLSARGKAEERINLALQDPLSERLDFADTALEEVVQYLQDVYDIPIQIDTQALDDVGISPDEPITVTVSNISLRSALRLVLGRLDLTYIIKDEVMLITTPEEADSELSVRVYPVADLVIPPIPPQGGGGGGGLGGGGGGQGGGGGGGLGGGGGGGQGGGGGGFGGGGGGFFSVPDESPEQAQPATPNNKAAKNTVVKNTVAKSKATKQNAPQRKWKAKAADIQIDQSADPNVFWNTYFSEAQREPALVRRAVRDLMGSSRPEHVTALIHAALRNGQPQPWMYESLGIAMELAGNSKQEIERAIMSAVDFSTTPAELLYIAQYLSRSGIDARALKLYRQVAQIDPLHHEAYVLGLQTAQRLEDPAGIQWATVGILSKAWPQEQAAVPQTALRVARAALEQLDTAGHDAERDAFQSQLENALVRDCIVRVSWTGDADVDLSVEEPAGTICSSAAPRSTGGGLMLGDGFAGSSSDRDADMSETYVCPQGFAGKYRARIHRVWGEVTAGKVTVDVYLHYGTGEIKHERQQLDLGKDDAIVVFDLGQGRRNEPIEEEILAGAIRRQQQIGQAVLAQQIDNLSDSGIIPTRRDNDRQRRRAIAGGQVGFQPQIATLPEGVTFSAVAVVSADKRYVRISSSPFFSTIGDISTFTFSGAAATLDDDDVQAQAQAQNQAVNINFNQAAPVDDDAAANN